MLQILLFAQDAETLLKQANDLYQKNEFAKAADIYQKIVNEGYESAELYYNLGNAYYKQNKLGFAILNYERALRIDPGDDDIQYNLALANSKTVDKLDTLPPFFLFQWWESLLAIFSISGWTYLAYAFYLLLLISIGIYFFIKRPAVQRYSVFSGLAFSILLIFTIAILIVNVNRELNVKNGIIIQPTVTAKLSPDNTSNDAFVIHEGLKVKIEDNVDNWLKVRLKDGKIGWLPSNDLRVI